MGQEFVSGLQLARRSIEFGRCASSGPRLGPRTVVVGVGWVVS
jgi:hypothetical protein